MVNDVFNAIVPILIIWLLGAGISSACYQHDLITRLNIKQRLIDALVDYNHISDGVMVSSRPYVLKLPALSRWHEFTTSPDSLHNTVYYLYWANACATITYPGGLWAILKQADLVQITLDYGWCVELIKVWIQTQSVLNIDLEDFIIICQSSDES